MCKFCENIKTQEDFEIEKPYLLFEKQNENDIQEFHIEVPSDDGIRHSVKNVSFCPYCGRKLDVTS